MSPPYLPEADRKQLLQAQGVQVLTQLLGTLWGVS